jgi:hypothetical protein
MTSDEFGSQYKLLKQMKLKEGRSYTAEHLPTGRAVLIHIVEETDFGGLNGLKAVIEQLPPRDRSRVLATLMVDRSLVVVTQFLQEFEGIERWLRNQTSGPAAPQAPAGEPAIHGEFTRLFRSAEDLPIQPPAQAPVLPPEPQPAPPASSHFTDLFRSPVAPATPPPGDATIPPIRMVGLRIPMPADSPPVQPAPDQLAPPPPLLRPNLEPGGLAGSPPGPPRLVPNLGTSAGPSLSEVGPPRLAPNFGGPTRSPTEPGLAGWPRPDEVVIRSGDPPSARLPAASWQAPSEYTRLFGSVPQPAGDLAEVPAMSPPAEEPVERKRSYLPLFVILNVVLILATGLVVYFALRRC